MRIASPPDGARGRATFDRLLAAGEAVIAAEGFEAASSTAVAEAAGVSTGTFYRHFDDKHALLATVFATRLDELVDAVDTALTADRLLDEGLLDTLGGAVDLALDGYREHAGVLRAALARVTARPELRRIYWQRHDRAVEVVERFLRRAASAGLAPSDAPRARALALLVLVEGLNHPVLLQRDHREAADVRAAVLAALVHVATRREPGRDR